VSAAAAAHFANPRNDFWRLLYDAGFTPRLYDPQEQHALPKLGYGLTNAAYRTTPGSGDLRRSDFDHAEFEARIGAVAPRAVVFVGKEAYRGLWNERPELGPQVRSIGSTGLFVLPSTSPANAAVPYAERLRWFRALRDWIEPTEREAVRAVCLDADGRVLLVRFQHPVSGDAWWATVGGGVDAGESDEAALRREVREEVGLDDFELGPVVHTREHTFPWDRRLLHQRERFYLLRVHAFVPVPTIDLAAEGVTDVRWWTAAELADPPEKVVPADLFKLVRRLTA
jgi:G:T/U-mismatch repair DNA glycosylase/ADP-ribose pyrophosphatase YjhB (NUDIX family)